MNGDKSLETPFTPPISLIYGLHEALEMIHAEGVPEVLARHKRLAAALRAGCNGLGLPSYQQTDALSSTVVVLQVPEKLNGGEIVRLLYERHRTVIAGSRNKLSGRVIRIGCMGDIRDADIVTDLEHLDSVLNELRTQVAANAR
jgi:aspartate aminotransferase-like enzyme